MNDFFVKMVASYFSLKVTVFVESTFAMHLYNPFPKCPHEKKGEIYIVYTDDGKWKAVIPSNKTEFALAGNSDSSVSSPKLFSNYYTDFYDREIVGANADETDVSVGDSDEYADSNDSNTGMDVIWMQVLFIWRKCS